MRILGVDYGDSRIGLALSDPLGWTAQGLETLKNPGNLQKAAEKINEVAKKYQVQKIVVGFPRNMNGTIGPRGEKTQEFISVLSKLTGMEIIKWDERLTTVAANRTMHEMNTRTSRKKSLVDRIAAVYILQGYLDSIQR